MQFKRIYFLLHSLFSPNSIFSFLRNAKSRYPTLINFCFFARIYSNLFNGNYL